MDTFLIKSAQAAYLITGITSLAFGTAPVPFTTMTVVNSGVCVSATMASKTNYSVTASGSSDSATQFFL